MAEKRILVWFRNDLRLHDNEMLTAAIRRSDKILPVYFFDPRQFVQTPYQTWKTGTLRKNFLVESVSALRDAFRSLGGDLLIVNGQPEDLLPAIAEEYGITEVYHHREVASEETAVSSNVEDALWKLKINLKHFIGHTLYNKEDLPFPIKDIPDTFAKFRKKTEREAIVKPCFPAPKQIAFVPAETYGDLPDPDSLQPQADPGKQQQSIIMGGEAASIKALETLISNGSSDPSAFSKLSPWLSTGCLSPRKVYWAIKESGKLPSLVANDVLLGLLWRDFFRFMFKKHKNQYFHHHGFAKELPYQVKEDPSALLQWKNGETGNAAVDAVMQQLSKTGIISNAARTLAALYFVQVLQLDWTLGAAWYEEKLLDYAPATNWGSWANIAGVGNEPPAKAAATFESQLKFFESQVPSEPFAA